MKLVDSSILQFPRFNKAKVNAKHLKIRGLLNSRILSDGNSKPEKYKITTNSGVEYILAPDKEHTFSLEKYIGKIVVATGFLIPEEDNLQLVALSLPNPPIGSEKSKSTSGVDSNNIFHLKPFGHLLNDALAAV